jgi:membrane-associated phospholipid phosphatase
VALQSASPGAPSPDQPWPDDQPFRRIVQNLVHDFKALPNLDSLLILGAGAAGAMAVHPVDDDVANWMAGQDYSSYAPLGDSLGVGWVHGVAAIGTYSIGRLAHDAKATHVGSDLIRAQFMNLILTRSLKLAVDRERPGGGSHSFPSGHSSAAFTTASILHGNFGWKVGVPAYSISGFIAWARFRDGSHWVSDVVFGSALGLAVGRAVIVGHQPRKWAVVPTASKGGGGLMFIKRY